MSGDGYSLGDLRIDIAARRVRRGTQVLEVGGLSFDLLAFLLAQGQRVVSFDELMAAIWAPAVVSEETVTQRVKLLRQALGDDGRNPRYLRSVRGKGYQLCLLPEVLADAVSNVDTASTAGAASTADTASTADAAAVPAPVHPRLPRYLRWPLLLIALPLAAIGLLFLLRDTRVAEAPASERDELLQRARYYAGIGQKDDIERAVALYRDLLQRDAGDVDAQLGLSFAYSTRVCLYNQPPQGAVEAQALAEAVLAADARNSRAEAALAYSHDCRGNMRAAIEHYEKAVALDPQARVDSAASLAYLYMIKGRLADALARNLAAQRGGVKPRYLDIQIARNLELLGEAARAGQRYERSFRLYPDNVYSNGAWPRHLFVQGRLGEAEAALAEAQRRGAHPEQHLLAAELALLRGQREAAAQAFAAAAALRPHASLAQTLAHLYGREPVDPQWIAGRIAARDPGPDRGRDGWPEDQLELALLQLARDDKAAALASLGDAVAAGFLDRPYLQTSALFRPLAEEPGFAALLENIAGRVADERQRAPLADVPP
jgi:DNA-binding winged helix-turn-helix (wHTH) protein/Tfp pilus assembly protein PilF